jgi:hypothetical protein
MATPLKCRRVFPAHPAQAEMPQDRLSIACQRLADAMRYPQRADTKPQQGQEGHFSPFLSRFGCLFWVLRRFTCRFFGRYNAGSGRGLFHFYGELIIICIICVRSFFYP